MYVYIYTCTYICIHVCIYIYNTHSSGCRAVRSSPTIKFHYEFLRSHVHLILGRCLFHFCMLSGLCQIWMLHVTFECISSHTWISLVHFILRRCIFDFCILSGGVMSHTNTSCHIRVRHVTCACVMSTSFLADTSSIFFFMVHESCQI